MDYYDRKIVARAKGCRSTFVGLLVLVVIVTIFLILGI